MSAVNLCSLAVPTRRPRPRKCVTPHAARPEGRTAREPTRTRYASVSSCKRTSPRRSAAPPLLSSGNGSTSTRAAGSSFFSFHDPFNFRWQAARKDAERPSQHVNERATGRVRVALFRRRGPYHAVHYRKFRVLSNCTEPPCSEQITVRFSLRLIR